jgi:hypothetical protein
MMYCRQVVFEVISGTEASVSEKSHVRDFVGKAELGKLPVRYIDTAPYRYREKIEGTVSCCTWVYLRGGPLRAI